MNTMENESQQEGESQYLPDKSKNKKILLIFVLVIMIASVVLVTYIKNKEIREKINALEVETLDSLTGEELDILGEASKQEVLKNKQDDCDGKSGEEKEECLEMLKSLQVTFLEDEELCEQLDDQKDQCFKNLAINKKDIEICNKIEDESLKVFCMDFIYQYQAETEGNVELCDNIQENFQKEICIESVFEYAGSIEMCNSDYITNNNLVDKCMSIILLKRAILLNDFDMCEQIPLEEYKEECLQFIEE